MAVQRDSESPKLIGVTSRTLAQDGSAEPSSGRPRARDSSVRLTTREIQPSPQGRSATGANAEAKLTLIESLLEIDDMVECAERAARWLFERERVKHVICAVVDQDLARLVGVAGAGVPASAVREFFIDLGDRDDPLTAVLASGEPASFRRNPGREHPWTPFGNASFTAFPLGGSVVRDRASGTTGEGPRDRFGAAGPGLDSTSREIRPGILLTNLVPSRLVQDIRWLAGVLGPQVARLLAPSATTRAYELDLKVRAATAALIQQNEILNQQNDLLNQQRLALEQASSLKSQFLANMSHEFRTPLNAILGYTSMLLQGMGGELNPQQTQMLARVDSNGRNLLSLINDILDISRIEAGKMPVYFAEFRVSELVPELLGELDPMVVRSKLSVHTELGQVPPLRSDRQKVKQILLNLITNALKFTPKGSVTITTVYDPAARQISASVTDTGIGISEDDQTKLFNDFQQADSSPTRQYGGAGLGLSICRRLAAMLGGHITLVSKLGEGSTFTLVLPRQARHR